MPKVTNPKTLASMDTGLGEDEEDDNREYEAQEYEDEPEAFIPNFTIAPEEIPIESQIPTLPTEEEQKNILESLYHKLGVNVKQALREPPLPMTPEKDSFVRKSSHIGAMLTSQIMVWLFSIPGSEYSAIAFNEDECELIIIPFMRIYARHSKLVGTISPDIDDLSTGLKALSAAAHTSYVMLQQIREDKARNNGSISTFKTRPSNTTTRSNDTRGFTANGIEYDKDNGSTESEPTRHLTDEQQYNYDKLQQLSKRDYEHRARQSGRI